MNLAEEQTRKAEESKYILFNKTQSLRTKI